MNEYIINRAKTCAITGHRNIGEKIDENSLKELFYGLIDNEGYDTFLVGMALGFDTLCYKILTEIKKEKKITLIACIPCPEQSNSFNKIQKEEYDKMLEHADEKFLISPKYTNTCMLKRNDFMVNNASCLVAYIRRNFGGTYYTVKKAEKGKIKIIKV